MEKRDGLTFEWAKYTRPFAVNAEEKYANYRIDFTGSADAIELAEVELMGNIKASIDRGTLENLVKTAESKDLSGYPAAKVEEFQAVLDAAKAVLENEDATIEEIREAVENLQKAFQ